MLDFIYPQSRIRLVVTLIARALPVAHSGAERPQRQGVLGDTGDEPAQR